MNLRHSLVILFWICLPFFVFSAVSFPADSMKNSITESERKNRGPNKEITLDEIEIQGMIEKPSVIIVPKRIEPDLREVELNRSFVEEVKEGVGDIPKSDEPLRKVEPAPSIKKTLEKKRD